MFISWRRRQRRNHERRVLRLGVGSLEPRISASDWGVRLSQGVFSTENKYASMSDNLTFAILGTLPAVITEIEWWVPDKPVVFADYIHTSQAGTLIEFYEPDPFDCVSNITLRWGPRDVTTSITVTVYLANGESRSSTGTFNIDEPVLTGPAVTHASNARLDSDPALGGPIIEFAGPGQEGVDYTAYVHADRPGSLFYIQLVKTDGTALLTDGRVCTQTTTSSSNPSGWLLDGASAPNAHYPFPQSQATKHTDSGGNADPRMVDSPATSLHLGDPTPAPAANLTYTFSAQLWLMYEQDYQDSRPIPVAKADWNWTATATLNPGAPGTGPSDWTLAAPPATVNPLVANDTWPTWPANDYESQYDWHCV